MVGVDLVLMGRGTQVGKEWPIFDSPSGRLLRLREARSRVSGAFSPLVGRAEARETGPILINILVHFCGLAKQVLGEPCAP